MISGVGDLCLMEAVEPSEYSYFNSAVVSAWAGPQHWKLKLQKVELKEKGWRCAFFIAIWELCGQAF